MAENWERRLRVAAGEASRRRVARAAMRREFARRRAHGLVDRQAQRWSRGPSSRRPG